MKITREIKFQEHSSIDLYCGPNRDSSLCLYEHGLHDGVEQRGHDRISGCWIVFRRASSGAFRFRNSSWSRAFDFWLRFVDSIRLHKTLLRLGQGKSHARAFELHSCHEIHARSCRLSSRIAGFAVSAGRRYRRLDRICVIPHLVRKFRKNSNLNNQLTNNSFLPFSGFSTALQWWPCLSCEKRTRTFTAPTKCR